MLGKNVYIKGGAAQKALLESNREQNYPIKELQKMYKYIE